MPGLDPGIHVFASDAKTWMAGTSPAMTQEFWIWCGYCEIVCTTLAIGREFVPAVGTFMSFISASSYSGSV